MKSKDILIALSIKYKGDFDKMVGAIKAKEALAEADVGKAVASLKCKAVTILDDDYPAQFKQSPKPPLCIFYHGDINLIKDEKACISYVGDRSASAYGLKTAEDLATAAAKNDLVLVSGFSRGIGFKAMKAAFDAGGKVVGVLPCGIDTCYPVSSKELCEELKTKGLVISEYPLKTVTTAANFPMRNRLIAAISHTLIVGEAAEKSGSLITVSYALGMGKEVGCVPFPAGTHSACNMLIKEGAYLIDGPDDLIDLITGKTYAFVGKEDK